MFKKFYKEANDDIKADEELINSVIAAAHKKRVFQPSKYIRYTLPAAAAVIIVSAAVISMPFFDKPDDGVVIKETAVHTARPQSSDTPVPQDGTQYPENPRSAAAPSLPETEGAKTENTGTYKHSYTPPSAAPKIPVPQQESTSEPKTSETAVETTAEETGEAADDTKLYEPYMAYSVPYYKPETFNATEDLTDAGEISPDGEVFTTGGASSARGMSSGGGASSAEKASAAEADSASEADVSNEVSVITGAYIAEDAVSDYNYTGMYIAPPSGYRTESASDGRFVFVSDSGGYIEVTQTYNDSVSSPVYGGEGSTITVLLPSCSIYAEGADRAAVDELVNSLL